MQEITEAVAATLRRDEGWRDQPYSDHLGFLTIGYGFLIDPRKGGRIPRPVGEFWLRFEINDRTEQLRQRWPSFSWQPDDVRIALVNMAFQLGVNGVLNFRNMISALERGDRIAAGHHARDSRWYRQTPVRAERVARLLEGSPTNDEPHGDRDDSIRRP